MKNTRDPEFFRLSILNQIYLYFFLLHGLIRISSGGSYIPTDQILLDCGNSAGNSTAMDGRVWTGDTGSKFAPLEQPDHSSKTLKALGRGLDSDPVPYLTARVSRSQFIYKFPVSPGQKFIRLYFYPTSYSDFNRSDAIFSVKAGPHTLLNNFSASLTADSMGHESFSKEFCVNVEENQILNITFASSVNTSGDAYALVNGIEILSMPANLYYTPAGDSGLPFVGKQDFYPLSNNTALQTVYRLNVGGASISPVHDSGLLRSWPDDTEYFGSGEGVIPVDPTAAANLKYKKVSEYSAPRAVYVTARGMGPNKTENYLFNLTWELPVDSGFMYLVRLHFCEFQPEITKIGDRRFLIYIGGQTVENSADVIYWSGGNGIPVYKDYVIMIKKVESKQFVYIDLHPDLVWGTIYSDGILNGIEMFKLNDSSGSLAGPNPEPSVPSLASSKKATKKMFITIGGSLMGGLIVVSFLCCSIVWLWKEKKKDSGSCSGNLSSWCQWWDTYRARSTRTKASSLLEGLCRHFTLSEIRTATNNFDHALIVGEGGFGNVYKGHIDGGTLVAIKRLNPGSGQGAHEFKTEIQMLSRLRYIHLVSLIGYCDDRHEMILVYDYMINGTLRDHLYETTNDALPWKQRLEICIGAARGLHYLHAGTTHPIIHRDVKTTNILLDEKWVAKVSDFGLSKMGPAGLPNTEITTAVKGTWGYLDPEYIRRMHLTEKSDVYSFGVVLLEVLCARRPVNHKLGEDQVSLTHWAKTCIREGTLGQIIDPYLRAKIASLCLRKFVEITLSCLGDHGIERPTMGDVVGSLELALKLQESAEAAEEDMLIFCESIGAPNYNILPLDGGRVAEDSRSSGPSLPSFDYTSTMSGEENSATG